MTNLDDLISRKEDIEGRIQNLENPENTNDGSTVTDKRLKEAGRVLVDIEEKIEEVQE